MQTMAIDRFGADARVLVFMPALNDVEQLAAIGPLSRLLLMANIRSR